MSAREVGRLAGLWRYPVKSMAGERLEQVEVAWHGLAGDRRFAFVRPGLERSGFPWFTLRQRRDMVRYRPTLVDPEHADASRALVRTPDGTDLDVVDPRLAAEETWVGSVLRIGEMRMRVDRRDSRCVIVNVDPATGERDPRVLRTIARERGSCLGVHGSTVEPGRVAVGDPVVIEEP